MPKVLVALSCSRIASAIVPPIIGSVPAPNSSMKISESGAAFLISLKAGGTGITLHSADAVFVLDPWWNPAVEQQAVARAYRLGQNHELTVYRLLIENSIESNIQQMFLPNEASGPSAVNKNRMTVFLHLVYRHDGTLWNYIVSIPYCTVNV